MNRRALLISAAALGGAALAPDVPAAAFTSSFGGCAPLVDPEPRDPGAPAEIQAVWFSQPAYHWGDLARIVVVATSNVALIEMRVVSYGRALTPRGPGRFDGVYRMPFLPPLLDRLQIGLPFRFIARNHAGQPSSYALTIPVR